MTQRETVIMDAIWGEEPGRQVVVTRHANGSVELQITDSDSGVLASITLLSYRVARLGRFLLEQT